MTVVVKTYQAPSIAIDIVQCGQRQILLQQANPILAIDIAHEEQEEARSRNK